MLVSAFMDPFELQLRVRREVVKVIGLWSECIQHKYLHFLWTNINRVIHLL